MRKKRKERLRYEVVTHFEMEKVNVEMIHEKYIEKHVLVERQTMKRNNFWARLRGQIFHFGQLSSRWKLRLFLGNSFSGFPRKNFGFVVLESTQWKTLHGPRRATAYFGFWRKLWCKRKASESKLQKHSWKKKIQMENLQICQNIYNRKKQTRKTKKFGKIKIYQGKTWKCVSHDHQRKKKIGEENWWKILYFFSSKCVTSSFITIVDYRSRSLL